MQRLLFNNETYKLRNHVIHHADGKCYNNFYSFIYIKFLLSFLSDQLLVFKFHHLVSQAPCCETGIYEDWNEPHHDDSVVPNLVVIPLLLAPWTLCAGR
jgi:hypothetical protein